MLVFGVNGFEITIELIIRYLAKNTIDFEPFINSPNWHFARSKFLVDSNVKITFIIKKTAKRYDTESAATIYLRLRDGRRLDSVAQTELTINPNLWDEKNECVKSKAVCDSKLRIKINEELRKLKGFI